MTIKRYTYLIILLIATAFFAACTSEEELDANGYGKTVKAKVSLATRATGTPEAHETERELINDWWVLFVNNSGEIVKYIDRTMATDETSAVEREEFDLEIATGDYIAYSFANITKTQVETVTGGTGSLNVGKTMPDLTSVNFNVASIVPNGTNVSTTSPLIPMTGKQSVRFASGGMQFIELEVVRMVAKMEFEYRNSSSKKLDIVSLSLNSMQTDKVPLLPDYDILENGWTFPTTTYGSLTSLSRTYDGASGHPAAISLAAYSGSGTPASHADKFYMQESTARQTESKRYLLSLNVKRNGGSPETLYFMLDKTYEEPTKPLQTIYRNDYLIVPLNITDYIVSLDANFYPPIGGYPAIITEDKDKDEFYITFRTQGEFEILPTVYNASTGTNVYYPHWDYNSTTVTVTGDDIFTVPPHIDTTTGELLGKLSTNEGTAVIDVEIKVEVSSGVWQVYPRRIYIIRSNT